jgi:hypothetical protein
VYSILLDHLVSPGSPVLRRVAIIHFLKGIFKDSESITVACLNYDANLDLQLFEK